MSRLIHNGRVLGSVIDVTEVIAEPQTTQYRLKVETSVTDGLRLDLLQIESRELAWTWRNIGHISVAKIIVLHVDFRYSRVDPVEADVLVREIPPIHIVPYDVFDKARFIEQSTNEQLIGQCLFRIAEKTYGDLIH